MVIEITYLRRMHGIWYAVVAEDSRCGDAAVLDFQPVE
jgi:hypothetical protein